MYLLKFKKFIFRGAKKEMKIKIISIFVCLMLMSVFLTAAQNVENISVRHESEETDILLFDVCEVPDWKVGNKWIYDVENIIVDFEEPDLSVHLDASVDDLTFEVQTVSDHFYELSIEAEISGSYMFDTFLSIVDDQVNITGPVNISGNLAGTTIDGTITYNKTDLGIKQIHLEISGRLTVQVDEQPFLDRSLSFLNVPIPVDIILDIELVTPFSIIKFPLDILTFWGLPASNFSLSGTINSPWLRFANFVNNLIRIPGVIPVLAIVSKKDPDTLRDVSDILKDILPTIDIEYFLTEYLGRNYFEIQETEPIILCLTKDNITVPASPTPFEAYNISLLGSSFANIYYSEEVGNIIKITGNFQEAIPSVSNINAELKEYEYTP